MGYHKSFFFILSASLDFVLFFFFFASNFFLQKEKKAEINVQFTETFVHKMDSFKYT